MCEVITHSALAITRFTLDADGSDFLLSHQKAHRAYIQAVHLKSAGWGEHGEYQRNVHPALRRHFI